MQVNISGRPSYALAYLILDADEVAYVERGSIAVLSDGVEVRGTFGGDGIVRALKRKAFGGESLLFTEVHAQVHGVWVAAAPPFPGDVEDIQVTPDNPVMVESGSLLAYSQGVAGDARYSGLKTVLLHEGVAMLELQGQGTAIVSAYGAIEHIELVAEQSVIIDTGHLVGFSASITFDVGAFGSLASAVTTGEGLVARLTGPGRVYLQTRAERDLRSWLFPEHYQNTAQRT
jgi:uncharacterized protein (TIGR00266 family)